MKTAILEDPTGQTGTAVMLLSANGYLYAGCCGRATVVVYRLLNEPLFGEVCGLCVEESGTTVVHQP